MSRKANGASGCIAITGTTARTGALPIGTYLVILDVAAYVVQGASAVNAVKPTTPPTSSRLRAAGAEFEIDVSGDSDAYLAAITEGATGKLFYQWDRP